MKRESSNRAARRTRRQIGFSDLPRHRNYSNNTRPIIERTTPILSARMRKCRRLDVSGEAAWVAKV